MQANIEFKKDIKLGVPHPEILIALGGAAEVFLDYGFTLLKVTEWYRDYNEGPFSYHFIGFAIKISIDKEEMSDEDEEYEVNCDLADAIKQYMDEFSDTHNLGDWNNLFNIVPFMGYILIEFDLREAGREDEIAQRLKGYY